MAVVMQLHWDGISPPQYDQFRELVAWEQPTPPRPLFHVAWFADGSLNMFELWQTAEDFEAFLDHRFMPAAVRLHLPGEPTISLTAAHHVNDGTHNIGMS